ncbi:hypothetical protein HG537_0C04610 [Torulaspora globosa]|uniref:non-specific serine/threonine protein kinase n=1 Tax=Torulaspora globosa TaxID=48254 RepID=A0A7H9HTX5_9SACH|nr:hypothetical protein HG537_0C04610 [Torulaspora sp. CBS 2947]
MEFDTSFEGPSDDTKFIALVVSDNEDDYNSQEESDGENGVRSALKVVNDQGVNGIPVGSLRVSSSSNGVEKEKKRWSFMSNHSSSSSAAKKRWSALSNFTLDSGTGHSRESKDKENRDSKFLKRVSTHSSLSSHKRGSVVSVEGDPVAKSPHSMKRSSTGSSLRQLFGLIALNDENKENQVKKERDLFKAPSIIPSQSSKHHGIQAKERRNSNFRAPLAPVVNEANRQRHSIMLAQNNANGYYSGSSMCTTTVSGNVTGFHTHSPSMSSLSSITSTGSKWKFWKRGSASLSRSSSSQSLNIGHDNSSLMTDTKIKGKSSFADLHKAVFSYNNGTNANIDYNDNSSIASNSLKKRSSSSNISLNGLKHRSSQSSLKHKSSHNSLQRLKTRTKSNNTGDDSSSLTSQGPQISLPVPDQASRDKIRAKLRNSSSLLSLSSSTPVIMKDYDEAILSQILDICDIKHIVPEKDTMASLKNSKKLTTHVWSSQNNDGPVVFKKLPLGMLEDVTYSKTMCLQELKMLRLCKGTTGLPWLLHSYVIQEDSETEIDTNAPLFLLLILKDHGTPLSDVNLTSWSQALYIFWQCVTILYVAETKFQFEHRNLILEHILVDRKLNVTLCDLKCSRAQKGPDQPVIYTRLDHPLFFQGGGDYQYEIYKLMRFVLAEASSWEEYEPRTNLMWLHYLCVKFIQRYEGKLNRSGSSREKLIKLTQLIDQCSTGKRGLFKRHDIEIRTCGDLLRFK